MIFQTFIKINELFRRVTVLIGGQINIHKQDLKSVQMWLQICIYLSKRRYLLSNYIFVISIHLISYVSY